ncbi:MAG: PEP-CTERM sorting domain-containing protein [Cyanobacterium sp. T60_A2020_053]|nr:PEP-CTERM sorting domain-containing protein [Cyanobacterium sp. T60_A2020_053]
MGAGTFLNTITPQDIGGINTSLDYFFDNNRIARVLATFTNTTGSSQGLEVLYGGDLGSDSGTVIENSSSGDNVFQQSDRWFISSDTAPFDDPILTFVRYGLGNVEVALDTFAIPGTDSGNGYTDYFTDVWNLTIGAGETQRLMWFVQMNEDLNTALSETTKFDDLTSLSNAGLLEGLDATTQGEIVNWSSSPQSTPEPSILFGLGALVLLGGVTKRKGKDKDDHLEKE